MKGVDSMAMPQGSTLDDLVKTGIDHTHAAVGVVVRLREELSLVKDIPVLFAIDQVRHKLYTFYVYLSLSLAFQCEVISCAICLLWSSFTDFHLLIAYP